MADQEQVLQGALTTVQSAAETSDTAAAQASKAAQRSEAAVKNAETAVPLGSPDAVGFVLGGLGALVAVAAVVAAASGFTTAASFTPDRDFVLFAGFYVVAQAVERLIEVAGRFMPQGSPAGKANAQLIAGAWAVALGVLASSALGLYFLNAVAVEGVPAWIDVAASGLLIAGGTAGLHELITRIEKAKQAAAAGAAKGGAEAAKDAASAAQTAAQAASGAGEAANEAAQAAVQVRQARQAAGGE